MEGLNEFDDIRPCTDEELQPIVENLIRDERFQAAAASISGGIPFGELAAMMRSCQTVNEFQKKLCYPIVTALTKRCSDGVRLDISSIAADNAPHVYLSNHRDIVLDSGLLSIELLDAGRDTVEIAIGDNLLIYPWIRNFVRINKAFIVKRGLSLRQQLEASTHLSRYIHFAVTQKKSSIWIAQREGRSKDSTDRTQESVIKMMAMGGKNPRVSLRELNIVPLTISYEYDPCDYLKVMEMQLKRDCPDYKKSPSDDLNNMATGITGRKGRIQFRTGKPLNTFLETLSPNLSHPEAFKAITAYLDQEIHANYELYECNYIASDLLTGIPAHADKYTTGQRAEFENYIEDQLLKVDLEDKDYDFLHSKILEMYANPLLNKERNA